MDGTGEEPCARLVDSFAIGGGMRVLLMPDGVPTGEGACFRLPALMEGIVPGSGTCGCAACGWASCGAAAARAG